MPRARWPYRRPRLWPHGGARLCPGGRVGSRDPACARVRTPALVRIRARVGIGSRPRRVGLCARAKCPPPDDMLLVPAGAFTMGADTGGQEDEHPAHTVTLAAFYLDKTEVTNAAWVECVAAGACHPKSDFVRSQHPDFDGANQPVSGISWDDARGYCEWRGKRLPREAEFEKAVRGTDDRRFPWGNEPPTHDRTVFGVGRPESVSTHPAGRGPYGHDDLAGNVWEWMQDEYDPYAYRRASAADGRPGSCAEIMAAQDELRHAANKEGYTGSEPDSHRVRAFDSRGCVQLRSQRAPFDESSPPSGPVPDPDARRSLREGRLAVMSWTPVGPDLTDAIASAIRTRDQGSFTVR